MAYLTYSVYPSTWVKGSSLAPLHTGEAPGAQCGDPMDSTTRLPAEPLCIVGSELLSFLGDWKSLLWFCWTGPGDCFPSKAIGGTSVGSFAKISRQNPRVQGHFQPVPGFLFHRNFFFFLNLAPNMLPKAMFRLSWITTVKYYSCTVPNLALACSDKTLLCIL